jgi:hypothetical protein
MALVGLGDGGGLSWGRAGMVATPRAQGSSAGSVHGSWGGVPSVTVCGPGSEVAYVSASMVSSKASDVVALGCGSPMVSHSLFCCLLVSAQMVHGMHSFLYFDVRTQKAAFPLHVG